MSTINVSGTSLTARVVGRHFLKLPEPLNLDWGVCINPRSPRSGLLTFEHQGCEFFEYDDTEVDLACC